MPVRIRIYGHEASFSQGCWTCEDDALQAMLEALVDPRAYERIFAPIVDAGYPVLIVKPPLGLAFTVPDAVADAATRAEADEADVEVIHLARRRGYRIEIVPIRWHDVRGSRMRPGARLALRVAWDLFRIPLLHRGVARRR